MQNRLLLLLCCFPFLLFSQAGDSLALKHVDSLILVSGGLTDKKDFDKALEINSVAENFALEKWGRESVTYANACFNHGRIFESKGAYIEAEKWYLDTKIIWEKVLGKEHLDYLKVLNALGGIYLDLRDFTKCEQFYLEHKAISLQTDRHDIYAKALGNLALLYDEMGKYEQAELAYLEAIAFREKLSGKENPEYATCVNNLGLVYMKNGQYDKGEPFLLEGMQIRERTLGKEHAHYGSSMNNLANLYASTAHYEKALPYAIEAKEIRAKLLGKTHPRYGWSLNNLASLYAEMGDYEKAELLFTEALEIKEQTVGKEHSDYGKGLNNLAILSRLMGNYEKSEKLGLEARSINERMLGNEHPEYLSTLENLGNLYSELADYKKSEIILLEVKRIIEKKMSTSHPEYAICLSSLANVYQKMGAYAKAEWLYLEADTILKKALGTEHPFYATNLHNLAATYQADGEYDKAEPLYLEAKAIREKTLGKSHPDFSASLNDLAQFYWASQQLDLAKSYLLASDESEKKLLVTASRYLSERELSSYVRKFEGGLDRDFSFAHVQMSMSATCYDNILFYKGYLLNAVAQVNKLALADAISTEQYLQLKACERRLAAEYAKPLSDQKDIVTLEKKANDIEKELIRRVAGFGEALRQVSWEEVQQQLQPGQAAIEFVHYNFMNRRAEKTDTVMYAALVLLPDTKTPVFVPLFEEKQLDALLQSKGKRPGDYVNGLYSTSNDQSLYTLLFNPLEKVLSGTTTIYFAPSGLLHRLNVGAITLPQLLRGQAGDQTLSDHYRLIELGSTRSLVIPSEHMIIGNDAMLYGGIQYEMDSTAMFKSFSDMSDNGLVIRGGLDFFCQDSTLRGGHWNYLKWTDVEISAIEALISDAGLNATAYRNYAATEESFKNVGQFLPDNKKKSPRILHIATHGFFFPDPQNRDGRNLGSNIQEPVFKISDHPMIRSGLILAGGNHAWQTGLPAKPGMEDGILTAYEISQMNLSNTELVVLSACETGLGDIQGNEGVYGLQRAFKIAGAKYLIMSLWQVPDFQTQELMTTFYTKWLPSAAEAKAGKEEKMTVPDAFRSAQKTMKAKYKDPFLWAGFVLVE